MWEALVAAFVNLASWNVNSAPEPVVMVRQRPARDARGRFVKVA